MKITTYISNWVNTYRAIRDDYRARKVGYPYDPRIICPSCNKPIQDEQIQIGRNTMHPECFWAELKEDL